MLLPEPYDGGNVHLIREGNDITGARPAAGDARLILSRFFPEIPPYNP